MRGLLLAFVALALGWSVAWFVAASIVDDAVESGIARLAQNGTAVECAERETQGFPFALRVRCGALALRRDGLDASVPEGATAGVSILRPTTLVVRPGTSATLTTPQGPVAATWDDLAIEIADLFGDGALTVDLSAARIAAPQATVTLARYRGSVVPTAGQTRLEGQGTDVSVTAGGEGARTVPIQRVDWSALVDGDIRRVSRKGGVAGTLLHAAVTSEKGGSLGLAGPFRVSPEGLLSGEFTLAIADPQGLQSTLVEVAPELARGPASLAIQAVPQMGQPVTIGGIAMSGIEVAVENGRGRLGFVAFDVPPLW